MPANALQAKLTDCDSDRIREACEKEAALKRLAVMESAKQKLEAELQEAAARKAELETNEQRVACTDEMRALQVALAQKLKLAEDRLMIETDEKARALAKIKVLETEASELAEEAAKKETEIADMKEKMAALVELVTDMAAQFDALDEQLMSETAQKAEALRTNKELEFEATARKAELDSKEAEIAGMQWKLAAMEMQVAECLEERLRSEVSETVGAGLLGVPLPSKGGAAVKQTEDLQDQISELKALVAALKMSNSAKGAQAEYLGEKLRAADAQNTEALGKIATLERELAAAQAEVSEKLRQAEACAPELSGRLLNTKAELEARETEVEGLKAQLCEAQALISDLELFSSAKAAQTSALEEQLRSEAYEKALALAIIPRLEAEVAKAILVAQEAKEDLARANVYLAAYHPFAYGKTARVELLLDQLRSEAAEKAEAVARMEELQSQQLRAQVARSLRRHAVLEVQLQAGVAAGRGTGQVALRVKELEAAHAGGQGSAAPEAGRLQVGRSPGSCMQLWLLAFAGSLDGLVLWKIRLCAAWERMLSDFCIVGPGQD